MKRFKIIFSTTVLVAACTVFLQAQDLNTAIEAYNLGATAAQEGNYITAIEHLDRAMEVGSALGEEGASVVTDCKNLIPQLYLRHAKDLASAGDGPSSLPFLDKACLLYTSDAADDLLCVDLGGRRIIKKKRTQVILHPRCTHICTTILCDTYTLTSI